MRNIYKEFKNILTSVGENITDIVKLDYIYDTLLLENIYGMELPQWTKKVFPGIIC